MNKEFEFLNIIEKSLKDNSFLGNDCAFLKDYDLTISKDILIEDVHFSFEYMNPYEVAKKSLLVNISDILASGAEPKYVLIGLSGKLTSDFVKEFYKGISEILEKYNIINIGGDITKSDKTIISVTIIGDSKNRKISSRYNAKANYIVATIGEFGSSAQGLVDLRNGIKENYYTKIHKYPNLYLNYSSEIARKIEFPYAMMDSSDGLYDCLYQISKKSKVKINIEYEKIPHKTGNRDFVLYGGEDYGLVLCLNKKDYEKFPFLCKIGVCCVGSGVFVDNKKLEYKGFKHFE